MSVVVEASAQVGRAGETGELTSDVVPRGSPSSGGPVGTRVVGHAAP